VVDADADANGWRTPVAFTSLIALADFCLTEISVWVMAKLKVDLYH
jgi:hypothetical protein